MISTPRIYRDTFLKNRRLHGGGVISKQWTRGPIAGLVNIIFALVLILPRGAVAVNPFVSTNFGADPSAHVFDGRIYVYASHDRNDAQEFDMTDHHVYSTDDLQNWQDHGPALDVKDVPWGQSHLWAPDCNKIGDTYYLVICPRPRPPFTGRPIGLATSKSPAGPFIAQPKPIEGCEGIDPSLFVDDDGQAYIVWAGKGPQMAKMKPDMSGFAAPPITLKGYEHFFEGPWIFKRNGVYYLTYAGKMKGGSGDGGSGQWFSYATAGTPMGPYTFRGDFSRTDPVHGGGNIHGSQLEYQGKWYCFYHDFSQSVGLPKHGFKRSLRFDEMFFDADGSIQTLRWTDTGPKQLKWLNPYRDCEAECLAQTDSPGGPHAITTARDDDGTVYLTHLDSGDWARYAGVDFGMGAMGFSARVRGEAACRIDLHLDRIDGALIGTCAVPADPAAGWKTVGCPVKRAVGMHDLVMVVVADHTMMPPPTQPITRSANLFSFDRFAFTK